MTDTFSVPERRRPWSRRTRPGLDLAFAIPLFLAETGWLVVDSIYGYGLDVWAAQGDQARIDAAALAHIEQVRITLVVVLVLAAVAAVFRARWTVVAQLLVALVVGGAPAAAQQEWQHDHFPSGCVRYSANC
jgi:hypothetical protein